MQEKKKTKPKRTVALTSLGCKVNQFETASFVSALEEQGVDVVPFTEPADIYIINTCAVTSKAGAQSRHLIRRALRTNPKARIIVTGCYAQIASSEILEIGDQPICIVGNGNKHRLVDIALATDYCDLEMYTGDISVKKEIAFLPVKRFAGRTRAYLKIQDGCNRFCSYCIVPYARGRSRSLKLDQVLDQADVFDKEGYQEVVLTGIHAGLYGLDLDPPLELIDLIKALEAGETGFRYRMSSLEPTEISTEMLQVMKDSQRFMPHLHVPLQSGDDGILKKMNRRYASDDFRKIIEKCQQLVPEISIGVDVLVGFPGESDEAFGNTVRLLENLPVAYLHVFPYSKRPGTLAASMQDQIPKNIKEERVARLRELDHKKRTAFYGKQLGKVFKVLAESEKNKFRLMKGFTENYVPVYFEAPHNSINRIVEVKIERLVDRNVFGRIVSF
ncbi:MAG: tRNA (N(6)-L-threonylcarbamoyladenosine(37)-C(2))-methylthiotransferase MtaB [Proteobacteria bacterium]|nr:tRNA (N(6)-L-threonylcarbamoyladenosine(37)-C(2))-methylthiotransferase MtaB [Pseudomonadota bacterium]MBU1710747.1 tRNA (N(6)-L-threonylcarbamoyladenosine(37)-C(2))-methylthiotransferase MtaB [Pseudomonadota bacterium]